VRVHRVILDERARAIGIEGVDRHGAPLRLSARREVILSAGAVGSAHLLLRSGIGDPAHLAEVGVTLGAKLPGVGHNLQDHLIAPLIAHRPRPMAPQSSGGTRAPRDHQLRERGALAASRCEAAVFVRTRPGLSAPDVQLGFLPVAYTTAGAEPRREEGITIAAVLLQPRSRGRILLRGPEPAAPPMINPGYLSDEAAVDLRTLVRGVRIAWRLLHTTRALAPFADAPRTALDIGDDAALARFVRRSAASAHHPAGSCRMGTDEMAVVDGELRVHGVERLRVVDASVMPTITRGHPRALAAAIAERAADLITGIRPAGVPKQRP
jgi:choline dehydrogenase